MNESTQKHNASEEGGDTFPQYPEKASFIFNTRTTYNKNKINKITRYGNTTHFLPQLPTAASRSLSHSRHAAHIY